VEHELPDLCRRERARREQDAAAQDEERGDRGRQIQEAHEERGAERRAQLLDEDRVRVEGPRPEARAAHPLEERGAHCSSPFVTSRKIRSRSLRSGSTRTTRSPRATHCATSSATTSSPPWYLSSKAPSGS